MEKISLCLLLTSVSSLYVLACTQPNQAGVSFDPHPEFLEGEIGETLWDFGDGEGQVPIGYRVEDGWVVVGGDMAVATAANARAQTSRHVSFSNIGNLSNPGWPGDRIDYHVPRDFDDQDKASIQSAIQEWTARTPFRFVQRFTIVPGVHTLVFRYKQPKRGTSPCLARGVGYTGGGTQEILVDPKRCGKGSMAHEIGHALGLKHEHQRTDRDDFLTVNWSNIPLSLQPNFYVAGSSFGDYDRLSLMHYSNFAGSMNGQPTLNVNGCVDDTGPGCKLGGGTIRAGDAAGALRANHGAVQGWRLVNVETERCLIPVSGSAVNAGDSVMTAVCGDTNTRRWYKAVRPDGKHVLVNVSGRVCLSSDPSSNALTVETCGSSSEIEFELVGEWDRAAIQTPGNRCVREVSSGPYLSPLCDDEDRRRWILRP